MNPCRKDVINLYKTLLHMGRDYPQGYDFFKERLKKAFQHNKDVVDPNQIRTLVKRGEFVVKEIEALYMLKKYRTLKERYTPEETLKAK
ncbi:LYR motif-containing protein 5B [Adelges cooleyi]|uniref:LYR motif-containing protein 5B n=1 Tax=Adelges cooleyi TaxID=133065 RepID=UPI00217FE90E|nr:LYR motif-containing protein 5B [Adelges cooleyi]